jgi:hypothetical protein
MLALLFTLACGSEPAPVAPVAVAPPVDVAPPVVAAPPVQAAPLVEAAPALAPIAIPADGKYENVKVAGITVPMINLMDGGATLLVDTDGVKPRSWEEQYKRKSADLPVGYFDLHKLNANHDDSFEDDAIDKQGRWKMDGSGNLVQD